jgi:hypothetical protein
MSDEITYLQQMAHVQIHHQIKGPLSSYYLPTVIININLKSEGFLGD